MPKFPVRIELHEAKREDYTVLYEDMAFRGFTDTITSADGHTFQLPSGEYNYERQAMRAEVMSKARAAAIETGIEYSVLVTESAGRTYYNLDEAE